MLPLILSVCVLLVLGDTSRVPKLSNPLPSITSSLINLGKVDISVHVNTKESSLKKTPQKLREEVSFLISDYMGADPKPSSSKSCPCFKPLFDQSGIPEMLKKVLSSNDFTSFKDPMTSNACCEQIREETIIFDVPKHSMKPYNSYPYYSLPNMPSFKTFPLDNKFASYPKMPSKLPFEVYFFPDKKFPLLNFAAVNKNEMKNGDKDIKKVGEKISTDVTTEAKLTHRDDFVKDVELKPKEEENSNEKKSVKKDLDHGSTMEEQKKEPSTMSAKPFEAMSGGDDNVL